MEAEQHPIEHQDENQGSEQQGVYLLRPRQDPRWVMVYVLIFVMGLGSGYFIWGRSTPFASQRYPQTQVNISTEVGAAENVLVEKINLPESYNLSASYGNIGPKLLESGAIDYDRFVQVYEKAGQPLTADQKAILRGGSDTPIVIDQENAYFLLNFFWAFGLVNQNPILTEGPMVSNGVDKVGRFASTGGWTIGTRPSTELYASSTLVSLTPEQQARLEQVAKNVYRPCCNNPTHFPDCNHGMAMLGVLELLASQDASEDEMFAAAKYLNAFWFPQQTYELATYMKMERGLDFADISAQEAVSRNYFSGSGFQDLHQWLVANDGLEGVQGGGNSCGV